MNNNNIIPLPTPNQMTTEPTAASSDLSQDQYNAIRDTIHELVGNFRDNDEQHTGAIQAVVDAAVHESFVAFDPESAPHFLADAVTMSVNEEQEQLGTEGGYIAVNENGQTMHDMVAEKMLGRPLLPTETVIHLNGNTLDNRSENLRVVSNG
jgi:HNH endonuclease